MPQQTAAPKKSGKGLKIGGIIVFVLGILSVVGSFANETYFAMLNYGMDGSDAAMIGFQIAMMIGGIMMISKSGKR